MGARQFIFVDNLMMSNFNFTLIVEEEQRKRGEIKFTILLKENIHKRLSYSLYLHKSHQVKSRSHSYYYTHRETTFNIEFINYPCNKKYFYCSYDFRRKIQTTAKTCQYENGEKVCNILVEKNNLKN